jgi:hypothetical protein
MNTETSKLLEQLSGAQWYAVASTLLSVVLAALLAFLIAYLKRKGEQYATREDFNQLLRQTEQTTRLTEAIKSQISAGALVGQSELEFRKAQLADFYGPIYSRLKLSRELYNLWMGQKLTEINLSIIDLFHRQNDAIIDVITTRAHLIDDAEIPEVFTRFMTSVTIWNFYTGRPGQPWIEEHVTALPQARWPEDFEKYIVTKTQELKRRLDDLHRKAAFQLAEPE